MAEPITTNGDSTAHEEDTLMADSTAAPDLALDPTDPQPPPVVPAENAPQDPSSTATAANPEHLSTIHPAAAVPPPQPSLQTPTTAAVSSRPGSQPPSAAAQAPPSSAARPEKPVAHGGPARQYLNGGVTPHLLEGMKYLAVYQPEKPLAWLAEFLRERSAEVEGA